MITTGLDTVMEWYEVSLDTQRTMKYLINKNPEAVPLKSLLVSKELKETNKLLDTAIDELNDLTIVSLVSIFEQTLIRYLKEMIQNKMDFEIEDEVIYELREYTINQAEYGRFTDIIDLFTRSNSKDLAGMVKQIYIYRNWVAHGKKQVNSPSKIDPVSAYTRLSDFLKGIQESAASRLDFS